MRNSTCKARCTVVVMVNHEDEVVVEECDPGLALRNITESLIRGDADLEKNRDRVHAIVKSIASNLRESFNDTPDSDRDDPISRALSNAPPSMKSSLEGLQEFIQNTLAEANEKEDIEDVNVQGMVKDAIAILVEAGAINSVKGIEENCQKVAIGVEVAKVTAQTTSEAAGDLRDDLREDLASKSKEPTDEVVDKISDLLALGDKELKSHKEEVRAIIHSLACKIKTSSEKTREADVEDVGEQIANALHEIRPEAKDLIEELQDLLSSTLENEEFENRFQAIQSALQDFIKDLLAGLLDQIQGGTELLAKLLEKNSAQIHQVIDTVASSAPLVREAAAAVSEEIREDGEEHPILLNHPEAAGGVSKKFVGAVLEGNLDLQRERERVEAAVRLIRDKIKVKVEEDEDLRKLYDEAVEVLEQVKQRPETQQLMQKLNDLAHDEKTQNELQQKLEENKDLLQNFLKNYATVIFDQIEGGASDVAQTIESKSGGLVRIKGGLDVAKDALPLAKEKAQAFSEHIRKYGNMDSLSQNVQQFRQRDEIKALEETARNLDSQRVIEWGEKIARDADARREFVNDVITKVLEFLISHLPGVTLPPISGEREGLEYRIANIDLGSFRMRKENIDVRLNPFESIKQGAPFFLISITGIEAELDHVEWAVKQNYFPHLSGEGTGFARLADFSVELGLQLVQTSGGEPQLLPSGCELEIGELDLEVRHSHFSWLLNTLTDLFAASLREYIVSQLQDTLATHLTTLSDTLNSFVVANWSVVANFLDIDVSQLPDAGVAQDFILRARMERLRKEGKNVYSVQFEDDGPLGLAFAQKHEYVVVKEFRRGPDGKPRPAEQSGEIQVGDILVAFNGEHVTSLPLEKVMDRLRRVGRPLHLTFMAPPPEISEPIVRKASSDIVDVSFSESKLYLVISSKYGNEMDVANPHDFSVVVKGFKPKEDGSKGPAEACGGVQPGMVLASVNKLTVVGRTFRDVRNLLANTPDRPLLLRFTRDPHYSVTLQESPSDVRITRVPDGPAVVTSFQTRKGPAEEQCSGQLEKGFLVKKVNGEEVPFGKFSQTVQMMRGAARPMEVLFGAPETSEQDCTCNFPEGSPMGIIFYKCRDGSAAFKAFAALPGPLQALNKVAIGHVLLKINGEDVPEDQSEIDQALQEASLPVTLEMRDMLLYERLVSNPDE